MITYYEIKCYVGTKSEATYVLAVGTMAEIYPSDQNYKPADQFYAYRVINKETGDVVFAHYGIRNKMDAYRYGFGRVAAYGNGGFPLYPAC